MNRVFIPARIKPCMVCQHQGIRSIFFSVSISLSPLNLKTWLLEMKIFNDSFTQIVATVIFQWLLHSGDGSTQLSFLTKLIDNVMCNTASIPAQRHLFLIRLSILRPIDVALFVVLIIFILHFVKHIRCGYILAHFPLNNFKYSLFKKEGNSNSL